MPDRSTGLLHRTLSWRLLSRHADVTKVKLPARSTERTHRCTPNTAQGLPFVGELGGRDSHSSAFFSTPGTEKLYSGTAKIRASATATFLRKLSTSAGKPRCSTSAL